MYSRDFGWRAVTLHYAYGVPSEHGARIFGVMGRTVRRWYSWFKLMGDVQRGRAWQQHQRDPRMLAFVAEYVKAQPCFYVEEIRTALREAISFGRSVVAHDTARAAVRPEAVTQGPRAVRV